MERGVPSRRTENAIVLLLCGGWQVVRLTWRQLRDGADEIAADLRGLLSAPTL
jgi:hypothetical protein